MGNRNWGFPWWLVVRPPWWCRRHKRCMFDPWVGKITWKRAWQPTVAWRISWAEESGRLQSVGSHWVRHNWSNLAQEQIDLWCENLHQGWPKVGLCLLWPVDVGARYFKFLWILVFVYPVDLTFSINFKRNLRLASVSAIIHCYTKAPQEDVRQRIAFLNLKI